jgi:hypothetical protein
VNPGRTCPAAYGYSPTLFREVPVERAETLYAVGGLYGNSEALAAVLELKRQDERSGPPVTLVFNGDFNWFNVDVHSFRDVNNTVLAHTATLGNVEAELRGEDDAGCGCAYPSYVDDATVERSNQIMRRLRETASQFPELVVRLTSLPKVRTFEIADERIGVLHGDPTSLAGWRFSSEALDSAARVRVAPPTPEIDVIRWFSEAGVRVFLSTHTCLPVMRDFQVEGKRCVVANNGSAGMPNFRDHRFGLITRVSTVPASGTIVDGLRAGRLHVEALAVHYNHELWVGRFLASWPQGSPAHTSYYDRICGGTGTAPDRGSLPGNRLSAMHRK